MWSRTDNLLLFAISSIVKACCFHLYHSTDFEVHRNWMAITYSLPIHEWYTSEVSEWTLDYPPFFAWFEFILSHIASFTCMHDPLMLSPLHTKGYESVCTLYFQRWSVVVSDFVLYLAVCKFISVLDRLKEDASSEKNVPRGIILLLVLLSNTGLMIVDHVHFQYNGFLLGIYIYSIACIRNGEDLKGAIAFAILLNFKHIFAYVAPVYFVYLLSNYCFQLKERPFKDEQSFFNSDIRKWSTICFLKLSCSVLAIFLLSFGPFIYHGQLFQVLSRLAPVKRGLSHAYWAPNVWAAYNTLDRVLGKLYFKSVKQESLTRGLVGDIKFQVLPEITPSLTLLLTLAFMAPILWKVFKRPMPSIFAYALNACMMCAFMCGWHVHEKAILMVTVPMGLMLLHSKTNFNLYAFVSTIGHFSLFPLLHTPQETPIKIVFLLLHFFVLAEVAGPQMIQRLKERRIEYPSFGRSSLLYLSGLVLVQLFSSVIQPLYFAEWEFLPLMLVSCYCSVGMIWSWRFVWYVFGKEYELNVGYL